MSFQKYLRVLSKMSYCPERLETSRMSETSDRCNFFVARKKRLCRMSVRPGALYCGEHRLAEETDEKRIPCPLDPKHTCYLSKLEKHLTVCNAKCKDLPSYIVQNYNRSPYGETDPPRRAAERRPLSDASKELVSDVIATVEKIYADKIEGNISELSFKNPHPSIQSELQNEKRANGSKRHLVQTSSLLNIIESENLVSDNTCFVELGAGRGQVSYYLAEATSKVPNSSVLLIDRASHRHKHDNKLDKESHNIVRVRADISDLALAEIPVIKTSKWVVGVSKHLCGIATDLALTCLTNSNIHDKTKGIVMATCCHHRCVWDSYVGRKYLEECNISASYFDVICGLVSWATCGTGLSRERRAEIANAKEAKKPKYESSKMEAALEEKSNSSQEKSNLDNNSENNIIESGLKDTGEVQNKNHCGFSFEQRCVIGLKTKAVLDWGRIEYLKSKNFDVKLCFYVNKDVSPENVCIIANKK